MYLLRSITHTYSTSIHIYIYIYINTSDLNGNKKQNDKFNY